MSASGHCGKRDVVKFALCYDSTGLDEGCERKIKDDFYIGLQLLIGG